MMPIRVVVGKLLGFEPEQGGVAFISLNWKAPTPANDDNAGTIEEQAAKKGRPKLTLKPTR